MRHLVAGRKLKRTASHRKALLSNLAASLIAHKRLTTTEAKAKELRPFVEKLITKAKHALAKEKAGTLPSGQTIDIHNRRMVAKLIPHAPIIEELFESIAPVVEDRNGGYTRIVKTGQRRGDAARMAIIELVDWAEERDGRVGGSRKRKATAPATQEEAQAERAAAALSESLQATAAALDSMASQEEAVEEAPAGEETAPVENAQEAPATEEAPAAEAPATEEPKSEDTPPAAPDNETKKEG